MCSLLWVCSEFCVGRLIWLGGLMMGDCGVGSGLKEWARGWDGSCGVLWSLVCLIWFDDSTRPE